MRAIIFTDFAMSDFTQNLNPYCKIVTSSSVGVRRCKGCSECGKATKLMCSKCKSVRACGPECFAKLWPSHKVHCRTLACLMDCREDFLKLLQFSLGIHNSASVKLVRGAVFQFKSPTMHRTAYFADGRDILPGTVLDRVEFDFSTGNYTCKVSPSRSFTKSYAMDIKPDAQRKAASESATRVGVKSSSVKYSLATLTRATLDDFVSAGQNITLLFRCTLERSYPPDQENDEVACVIVKSNGWIKIVGNRGPVVTRACDGWAQVMIIR